MHSKLFSSMRVLPVQSALSFIDCRQRWEIEDKEEIAGCSCAPAPAALQRRSAPAANSDGCCQTPKPHHHSIWFGLI